MEEGDRAWWWGDTAVLGWLALMKVVVHFATNGNYGYFRDELYYLACSEHPSWGYVDHPPLSIAILSATRALLGDSIFAIRLPAVLAGAATVFATGILARHLGGGRYAQILAALACATMPFVLGVGTMFSMNAFEPLFWLVAVLLVVRIVNADDPRLWPAFGIVVGLGLLNKYTIGMLVAGLAAGLVLTERRRDLGGGWIWLGGLVAAVLILPNLLWQLANGFPTAEFIRVAADHKITQMGMVQFLSAQTLYAGPFALPLWVAGVVYFTVLPDGRAYRMIGVAFVVMVTLLLAQQGKAYYLASVYPILFAGGAVAVEQRTQGRVKWLRPALVSMVGVGGLIVMPMAVPVLAPETMVAYGQLLGLEPPREERGHTTTLPQLFADRFGWRNMVATVAGVYSSLPPEDRKQVAIFTSNYGQAGAIDFFGARHGLPKAISGHNSYWLWGPGETRAEVVIAIGPSREELAALFQEIEHAATIVSPHAMPFETDLPVYVCRRPIKPVSEIWGAVKRFI